MTRAATGFALLVLVVACGAAEQPAPVTGDAATQQDAAQQDATHQDATGDGNANANVSEDASEPADASEAVSCDHREVICRVAEPVCPEMQVAQVIDRCFGPCVPIDHCVCPEAEACPHEEKFVCHRYRQRCGPYVN